MRDITEEQTARLKLAIYNISKGDFEPTDDEVRQIAIALQPSAVQECRHCGWMCSPNKETKRAWYPLEQAAQEPVDAARVRALALEEAALACEAEAVEDTGHEADRGYNMAIKHSAAAIRALIGAAMASPEVKPEGEGT
jgi:predicted metal-dependent hydrolase